MLDGGRARSRSPRASGARISAPADQGGYMGFGSEAIERVQMDLEDSLGPLEDELL
jgi:hypothetical protein